MVSVPVPAKRPPNWRSANVRRADVGLRGSRLRRMSVVWSEGSSWDYWTQSPKAIWDLSVESLDMIGCSDRLIPRAAGVMVSDLDAASSADKS